MHYVDAGHGLARMVRADGTMETPPVCGLPAGAVAGSAWVEGVAELFAGDTLVVFSDGILDLRPDQAAVDAAVTAASAVSTVQAVVERLVAPARSAHRDDDVTAIAMRRVR